MATAKVVIVAMTTTVSAAAALEATTMAIAAPDAQIQLPLQEMLL